MSRSQEKRLAAQSGGCVKCAAIQEELETLKRAVRKLKKELKAAKDKYV